MIQSGIGMQRNECNANASSPRAPRAPNSTKRALLQATIEALQEFDAESAALIRATASMKESEWRRRMMAEGLDVSTKRKLYMKLSVRRILVHDVQWQFAAFTQVGLASELGVWQTSR